MTNAQLIAYLKSALGESQSYDYNDDIQPSMRMTVNGDKLASQIRSLLVVLEADSGNKSKE